MSTAQSVAADPTVFVKRVMHRYDSCLLAHRAEVASRINMGENARRIVFNRPDILRSAVERHLAAADTTQMGIDPEWVDAFNRIGDIASFAQSMSLNSTATWWPLDRPAPRAQAVYAQARAAQDELTAAATYLGGNRDREAYTYALVAEHRMARLSSDFSRLPQLLDCSGDDELFRASGVEDRRIDLECERILALVWAGRLDELDEWLSPERTTVISRFEQTLTFAKYRMVRLLATYARGGVDSDQLPGMFEHDVLGVLDGPRESKVRFMVHEAAIRLTLAELYDQCGDSEGLAQQLDLVVAIVTEVQSRWALTARSHSPLAAVLRRTLGDVAVLAARSGNARVGFGVTIHLKQGAIAHLLQNREVQFPSHIRKRLNQLAYLDGQLFDTYDAIDDEGRASIQQLRRAERAAALQNFHDTCLDYVYPDRVTLQDVRSRLGDRFGVEYVLCETHSGGTKQFLFRLEVLPSGAMTFSELILRESTVRRVSDAHFDGDLRGLSKELFSEQLLEAMRLACRSARPNLLISPDTTIAGLPWAGLPWPETTVDESVERLLIEDVTVALAPTLACVSQRRPGPITGPVLASLIADPVRRTDGTVLGALSLDAELDAWGISGSESAFQGVGTFAGTRDVATGELSVQALGAGLVEELRDPSHEYGFLHVSAHGDGEGLGHELMVPQPLTAAAAFGLRWPANVLLAACHLGSLQAARSEPLAFSIAVLIGGAGSVVTSSGALDDELAGRVAASIIRAVRSGSPLPLADLLARAQLALHRESVPVGGWARLITYCD